MDKLKVCLILVAGTLIVPTLCASANTNPCSPSVYSTLNDTFRSTGFQTSPPHKPLCDDRLRRGWYRFVSAAGGEMPTTCQSLNHCGTTQPIWLNGVHPTVLEGIVSRQGCAISNTATTDPLADNCCEYSDDIFIKNCGTFYVYYLNPTYDCPRAYCAGNIPPCPAGKWSPTNLPPCRDLYPVLDKPPVLTGPKVDADKSIYFECEVPFPLNEPDQVFEVTFTFDGRTNPLVPTQRLEGGNKTAVLNGPAVTQFIGTNVGCQVVSYYVGREQDKSAAYKSATVYFGLVAPPVLSGPHIAEDNKTFSFECRINASFYSDDQEFEISWTFSQKEDAAIPTQVVRADNPVAVLDGRLLQGHLDSILMCRARLVVPNSVSTLTWQSSNTYFAGIQISPSPVKISEAYWTANVTVTSTIPIVCDLHPDCCLTFTLNTEESSAVALVNTCMYKLCASDWNDTLSRASTQITVAPKRNAIQGGNRVAVLVFDQLSPSSSDSYLEVFKGYQPGDVQVIIENKPNFQCSLTGDPHIIGFDFRNYHHLFSAGDYIAYRVPSRDFEVHIRTWQCGSVACICGLVVREGNDIVKIYGCDKTKRYATVDIAYPLSEGTLIKRSSDGARIGVHLPSGSEVNIYSGSMDVYITTPAFDFNQTEGLCGRNDGIQDGFTFPNGTVQTHQRACNNLQYCIPKVFHNAWSVSGNNSMFNYVPDPKTGGQEISSPVFCTCVNDPLTTKRTVACSHRDHVQTQDLTCPGCPEITDKLVPSYVQGVGWTDPSTGAPLPNYTHPVIPEVNSNPRWPNPNGVTQAQATEMCTKALQKSQLYSQCQDLLSLGVMENCIADILFGHTVEYLDSITSDFTAECQKELAKDLQNYQKDNATGELVLNPEIKYVCPTECEKHGTCGKLNTCVCDQGWTGETCHLEVGKGVELLNVIGGSICDVTKRNCHLVHINATNVGYSSELQCSAQEIDFLGSRIGSPIIIKNIFISPNEIACQLPAKVISTQRYIISASNDGKLFGNALFYHLYDSTCLHCDSTGCDVKTTACLISGVCYPDGYVNPSEPHRLCRVSSSQFCWTCVSDVVTPTTPPPIDVPTEYAQIYPTRPPPETAKPCHFCYGG